MASGLAELGIAAQTPVPRLRVELHAESNRDHGPLRRAFRPQADASISRKLLATDRDEVAPANTRALPLSAGRLQCRSLRSRATSAS